MSTIINYNGIAITLTHDAEVDNYGTDGEVIYTAPGTDAKGNRYFITWHTTSEWNEANAEGIDEETMMPNNSYCQDESNACDWDNPDSVELTDSVEIHHYTVIKESNRYTIGEYDTGYKAYIINDGICGYYYWDIEEDAQKAADAYNVYYKWEELGKHGSGNDRITADEVDEIDEDIVELYKLFHAVDLE